MSTRSDIIVHMSNGEYRRIYCHFDGYISGVGHMLFEHWNSQEMAEKIVSLGDLSALGETLGTKHPFDWRTKFYDKHRPKGQRFGTDYDAMERDPLFKKYNRMCLAYGRDRGDTDTAATVAPNLSAAWPEPKTWTEFTYVWSRELGGLDSGAWWVGDPDESSQTLKLLSEAIAGVVTVRTAIKAPWGIIGHR